MHLACDLSAAKTAQCCWTPAESSLVWWLNQNPSSAPSLEPRKPMPTVASGLMNWRRGSAVLTQVGGFNPRLNFFRFASC